MFEYPYLFFYLIMSSYSSSCDYSDEEWASKSNKRKEPICICTQCALISIWVTIIIIIGLAIIVVALTFISIYVNEHVRKVNRREIINDCHFVNSTLFQQEMDGVTKYLFRGQIGGTFEQHGPFILNIYNSWDIDNEFPVHRFTPEKGGQKEHFQDFNNNFLEHWEGDDQITFKEGITEKFNFCAVEPEDHTNFRICYKNDAFWSRSTCNTRMLENRIMHLMFVMIGCVIVIFIVISCFMGENLPVDECCKLFGIVVGLVVVIFLVAVAIVASKNH